MWSLCCLGVCFPFQFSNQVNDFYETGFEFYISRSHLNCVQFVSVQLVIAAWWMCEFMR